jgi:diadenosine tetraphosphate (Ap4A) HIT family hydrolase
MRTSDGEPLAEPPHTLPEPHRASVEPQRVSHLKSHLIPCRSLGELDRSFAERATSSATSYLAGALASLGGASAGEPLAGPPHTLSELCRAWAEPRRVSHLKRHLIPRRSFAELRRSLTQLEPPQEPPHTLPEPHAASSRASWAGAPPQEPPHTLRVGALPSLIRALPSAPPQEPPHTLPELCRA